MDWFTYEDAIAQFVKDSSQAPQKILFPGNETALREELPIPPYKSDGFLYDSAISWYGRIGSRVIVIEANAGQAVADLTGVLVHTPFSDSPLGDWAVLLELQTLPRSIVVSQPKWIESRVKSPTHVVYRRHSKGWNDPVYSAASASDADGLMEYLRQHPSDNSCFVGDPEPRGMWAILTPSGHRVGCYPDKYSALTVACQFSSGPSHPNGLTVRDLAQGQSSPRYSIGDGRVLGEEKG